MARIFPTNVRSLPSLSISGTGTVGAASFAAPPGYSDFVTDWTSMAQSQASNLATGGTDYADAEYGENAARSVFYSCARGLNDFKTWSARVGNSHSSIDAGRDRAAAVQCRRWAFDHVVDGAQQSSAAWHRAADVAYYALESADAGDAWDGDITIDNQDLVNHYINTPDGVYNDGFAFTRLNTLRIGSAENPSLDFYGRYTAMSRPVALLAKALVYGEMRGNARYKDSQQTSTEVLPLIYDCMINHIYRWRNEFLNVGLGGGVDDNTAPFMISLTVDAIRVVREWLIENGEDPELFFPSQVITGLYGSTSFITNPYTDSIDAVEDILTWLGSCLDSPTLDTTAYPHAASYCRVTHAGTDSGGGGEPGTGPLSVGDPMVDIGTDTEGDYAICRYRSQGSQAYVARNIQMMNVSNFWWLASVLNGVDNTTRDKMIEYGDKFFYGAVLRYSYNNTGPSYASKLRNQNLYTPFQGLVYRNLVTGRND